MDISDYAREYEASTQYFSDLISGLSAKDLSTSEPGGWTPRQVIHHLADDLGASRRYAESSWVKPRPYP